MLLRLRFKTPRQCVDRTQVRECVDRLEQTLGAQQSAAYI